jgi:hypothetical protein
MVAGNHGELYARADLIIRNGKEHYFPLTLSLTGGEGNKRKMLSGGTPCPTYF